MELTTADDSKEPSAKTALIAFVLPYAIYVVSGYVESQFHGSNLFYGIYAARIFAVCACLYWGRNYFPKFSTDGFRWGIAAGVLGFGLWILLTLPSVLEVLEFFNNERPQWNAWEAVSQNPAFIAFLIVRLFGLALVVPLMEELFCRGFLMRYVIDANFSKVPIGKITPFAFSVVTIFFVLVHTEIFAALVWGILINIVYWKTRNLWACIAMHIVTNSLLGIYILTFEAWHLW